MVQDGVYRGGISELNAAFASLQYVPYKNWHGMDTLTLTLNDLGNHGLGQSANATVVIAIEVGGINDSPTVVAPTTYYEVNEDETLQINGVAIFDVDASSGL